MKTEHRVFLVRAGCWALAMTLGLTLADMPEPQRAPRPIPELPKRIRLAAPRKPVAAVARESMPIQAAVVPNPKRPTSKVEPKPETPAPVPVQPAPFVPDSVEHAEKLVLEQPGMANKPPAPANDDIPLPTHLEDKPGGDILVLALQLNSDNQVLSTDILVASKFPLDDLALAMSMRGKNWGKVDPPIPPGQYRWLEMRVDYGKSKDSILP